MYQKPFLIKNPAYFIWSIHFAWKHHFKTP